MKRYPPEEQHKKLIGLRMAELRGRYGMTQMDLAERIGVSRNTIGNYERGEHGQKLEHTLPIVDGLNSTLEYLTDGPATADGVVSEPAIDSYEERAKESRAYYLPFVSAWDGSWPLKRIEARRLVREDLLPDESCLVTLMPDGVMSPLLERGDAIVVDPKSRKAEDDTLVVLRLGGHTLVRRVGAAGSRVVFCAEQGHADDIVNVKSDQVVGEVIALIGRKMIGTGLDLLKAQMTEHPV
jgi:transcriptional regulator with XRE-family HTH domain